MYFKVRKTGAGPDEKDLMVDISKMATIENLQKYIQDHMGVKIEKQRLFYKGKQLVQDCRVIDYAIQLNDVILLMIKPDESVQKPLEEIEEDDLEGIEEDIDKDIEENIENDINEGNIKEGTQNHANGVDDNSSSSCLTNQLIKGKSDYYEIGDYVDFIHPEYGAWFEARLVDILRNFKKNNEQTLKEEDLIFRIKMERVFEETDPIDVTFDDIRPRARYTYKKKELQVGTTVLVNYNIEKPSSRGCWYDLEITSLCGNYLKGNIILGKNRTELKDRKIKFINEVMKIEKPTLLVDRSQDVAVDIPAPRKLAYRCNSCKDVSTRNCRKCGCRICTGKTLPDKMLICDECEGGFHLACLNPPLLEVPEDDWYCPDCKTDQNEIVKAGERLKFSKKKAKMPSNRNSEAESAAYHRDWGHGMATVGRTKECTIVPLNHYGPVPGVEVGTCWKFRVQVSEAGVHRPPVAGIHGRYDDGAYSIVLSGGYEDDIDYGDKFYYTGSGGRDLSGNKRISEQSFDQTLTRMNKALALNCNAEFNDLTGAEAKNWKEGKPVRVVRNFKLGKYSKYAPKDGNRYDGVYKVVKYYPEKGKAGFVVWRYLLQRDDPSPAPWSKKGQELEMIYPPGYCEAQEAKVTKGNKRISTDSNNMPASSSKKCKFEKYKLDKDVEKLIQDDVMNKKIWKECEQYLNKGKQTFLEKVEESFMCICCMEVVYLPITTGCKHNVCQNCLKRSFTADAYTCPYCRFDLGKDYNMSVNTFLSSALLKLFPGYETGR